MLTCPHCERTFDGPYAERNRNKHAGACIDNPAYMAPIEAFILSIARDGRMPFVTEYNRLKPDALPTAQSLQTRIKWSAIGERLGLSIEDRTRRGFPALVNRQIDADVAHTRSIEARERLAGYGLTTGPEQVRTYTDRAGRLWRERYAVVY